MKKEVIMRLFRGAQGVNTLTIFPNPKATWCLAGGEDLKKKKKGKTIENEHSKARKGYGAGF